ncbi:MAG: flagellum-specific ATP synthase FliI, partial [Caldimonas sp.]
MSLDSPIAATQPSAGDKWRRYLADLENFAADPVPFETYGRLVRVTGLVLEAAGIRVPVGSVCEVRMEGQPPVVAEVVGFSGDRAYLMPTGDVHGLASGALVAPRPAPAVPMKLGAMRHPWRRTVDRTLHLPVGDGLLGRVIDSQGQPMDRKGPLANVHDEPLTRRPINAMDRDPVRKPLDTGIRAINAMLTVGRGQRIGLFAGTGVGKSVLLGMMARYTAADVIVVGLIGERGREVKEFIEDILGEEGIRRAVVVAAPADAPPLVRMQGANYATVIAEHFRDRGKNVLLLMDSLTRYAMAQREIALAIGEPPATKGYPPSCFA